MATKKISDLSLRSDFDGTVNLAGDDASQTWRVTGAQIKTYIETYVADLMKQQIDLLNLGLAASVSGNALTVALKTLGGSSDPSSSSPVRISFRGTTQANGDWSHVSVTSALSMTVSSGSTLGTTNGVEADIYVYALNNGGTVELAVSRKLFDQGVLQSTTAEGGAGAADSDSVLYSTTARTSKAIRLIGRIRVTEATAGTWATAPTELSVVPFTVKNFGLTKAEVAISGEVGEYLEATASSTTLNSSGAATNVTSLSLTAGDWDVIGVVQVEKGTATANSTNWNGAISLNSASLTGCVEGQSQGAQPTNSTNSTKATITVFRRIFITSTTTVYLIGAAGASSGNLTASGSLNARRRR